MPLNIEDKPYFNFQETAELLEKNKSTISRWYKDGVFTAEKDETSGEFKVSASEVQRIKDSKKGKGAKKKTGRNAVATVGKTPKLTDLKEQLRDTEHERELLAVRLESLSDANKRLEDDVRERKQKEEKLTDQINNLIDTVQSHGRLIEDMREKDKPQEMPAEDQAISMSGPTANENATSKKRLGQAVAIAVIAVILGTGGFALYSNIKLSSGTTVAQKAGAAATMEPAAGQENSSADAETSR